MPHPPQLFTSVLCVAVSQPFEATPSQSPKPAAQAPTTHLLAEHALTDTLGSAQTFVQLPQWFTSVVSVTQLLEQFVVEPPHVVPQMPAEHTWPPPHAFLQVPQLATSAAVFVSQPFAGLPSQSANPGWHAPSAHAPDEHVAPALG
jgi:hypothetical protein